jgi:Ca-activated chloride channel family protein
MKRLSGLLLLVAAGFLVTVYTSPSLLRQEDGAEQKDRVSVSSPPVPSAPTVSADAQLLAPEKHNALVATQPSVSALNAPAPGERSGKVESTWQWAMDAQSAAQPDQLRFKWMMKSEPAAQPDQLWLPREPTNRENYAHVDSNPVQRVSEHPVSTFSIDVDTGSYANVRRFLHSGTLPVRDAVRVEELINYFSYNYPAPETPATPFRVTTEIGPTPWNPDTLLLHVGIKGYEPPPKEIPPANLVFLIDVSGSMSSPDKLELVKSALLLLARQLRASDRLSIVVYAGDSGVVLEPTPGDQTGKIQAAIQSLHAGGSTNGGSGIRLAYAMAEQGFIKDGVNRVLLATDGDFNVGTVSIEALKDLIAEKRKSGIALTTLGVGTGNYNDHLMEQLADVGNGNYAYLDSLQEAQKVLVNQRAATLLTIAKDVKVQIEFNPAVVAEYRLIGYENRALRREDFANDKIDAGEIGAGHTVTALYEIALVGGRGLKLEPLRYAPASSQTAGSTAELALLRIRYKAPGEEVSKLQEWPLQRETILTDLSKTSDRFRFAAAVAAFGQQLRGGVYLGTFGYEEVTKLARDARGDDPSGNRGEFVSLVQLAQSLSTNESIAVR